MTGLGGGRYPRASARSGALATLVPAMLAAGASYRAENATELDGILGELPLHDWMEISVTPLESHPSDPG